MQEDDIIKLGRIKFRVKELRSKAGPSDRKKSNEMDEVNATKIFEDQPKQKAPAFTSAEEKAKGDSNDALCCRICLSEEAGVDDPFVSLCSCTGTMKLVHLRCLQHWLKSRLQVKKTDTTATYFWKTFECELCKTNYPSN